ncbi:MAG: baseplate J/gp47 family protein [Oscillospiraceae bacterium]|nr:baseplate J/gp47 family protein [Oscillospiraceae bacterium]
MAERTYPDIQFVETDTETIINSMIALFELMYEEMTGKKKKVYPGSPERLFISWCAAIVIQQRVLIEETAKKNVPRYAEGEYLDSLAELFHDIERLPAEPAVATFRCYISEQQPQSIYVPAGTRITFDGEITFATTEELEIKAGEIYGDVVAECQTAGTVGNDLAPGQVTEIVDVYDYFLSVENITKTSGGTDEEEDAEYYYRMRESMESFSTAGPENGYIYFAKSVSTAISDIAATSPEAGVVDVRVLLKDGQEATETILQQIEEKLNAKDVRPMTDIVTVSVPDKDIFNVDLTYYIEKNTQASSTIIAQEANAAVEKYIEWQTEKMGRDINPSKLVELMMAAGIKRVDVREPVFRVVENTHVAKLGDKNVINGGNENE